MQFQVTTAAPKVAAVPVTSKQEKMESLLFELVALYVEDNPEGLEKLQTMLRDAEEPVQQAS